ncbi:MAG TPA: hypothetical protein VM345_16235 [Acidimicrobiales bacterium]|nr:hypothetical protein [Acidimicrobiales bacterium]
MKRLRMMLLVAAATLAVAAACGADDASRAVQPDATSTTAPAAPTTTSAPDETLTLDWQRSFETALPNGWVIRDCEGERLNVCVHDGSKLIGDIELNPGYPLDKDDIGVDAQSVARRLAADMITHFRKDRSEGCAPFTFVADPVTDVVIDGKPGARGGFRLTDANGRVVERIINHYLVIGEKYAIVNTDAYVASGGCLGPTEYDPTFEPEALAELEPYLDRLLVATRTAPLVGGVS